MEDEMDDLLKDIRKERITQFILLPVLQQSGRGGNETIRNQDRNPNKSDELTNPPSWWQANPSPQ
jgi:hypothetical protein